MDQFCFFLEDFGASRLFELLQWVLGISASGAITWATFRFWRMPLEREWIFEHGILHWVYFHNIKWRVSEKSNSEDHTDLIGSFNNSIGLTDVAKTQLRKLLADLEAFYDLTRLLERRLTGLSTLTSYGRRLSNCIDASDELVITLRRHARILLDSNPNIDIGIYDIEAYKGYFLRGHERIFGAIPLQTERRRPSNLAAELERQRRRTLKNRLDDCEKKMTIAMQYIDPSFRVAAEDIWKQPPSKVVVK